MSHFEIWNNGSPLWLKAITGKPVHFATREEAERELQEYQEEAAEEAGFAPDPDDRVVEVMD